MTEPRFIGPFSKIPCDRFTRPTPINQIDNHSEYAKALRGLAQEKSGDNQAALKYFDRAIDLDPEYGAAYYSRANLHSKMGNEARKRAYTSWCPSAVS